MKRNDKTASESISSRTKTKKGPRRAGPNVPGISDDLRASEERLRNIFDTVPVSIWVEDYSKVKKAVDKLRSQGVTDFRNYLKENRRFVRQAARMVEVIDVNEMTLRLFCAKDKSELLGNLEKNLIPAAFNAFQEELIAIADGRTYFEVEISDQTLQGKGLHLWKTIVFPHETAGYKSVLVCLTDMTERKQAQEELSHSHSLLNAALESTADGILVVAADGKVTSYNRKFLELWRIPESLAAQQDDRVLLEFVLSQLKNPSSFIAKVEALYQSPETTSFDELEFLDGRVFERYSQAQRLGDIIIGRVWSFRDITERKHVEKALRESEARLLTVLEASPIPITLNSQEDGIVLYGNSALADFLGVSLSEIIGQRAADYYADPADRSRALAELERLGSLRDYEVRLRRSDDTVVWVSLSTEKTMLEGQSCLLSCFYDITERKRAEALQAAIYQISEAANKAISMDELFRLVHEIIGQVMLARNFYIALYDSESDLLSFPYYVDEVDGSESIPASKPGRGLTEYLIRTGKPLLSDMTNFEELARQGEVELVGPPSPIWVGAPLIVEERTIGAIALQDYHNPNVYTERELRMLEYVSGQVAKAIERTRLVGDIRRNNRILSALQEATLPLIKQTELSEVLQELLKQTMELFETTNGSVYLVKPDESELILSMGIGPSSRYIGSRLKGGEGLAGKVWQTGQPLAVDDYEAWSGRARIYDDTRFHATAAVPLTAKSKITGVLGIGHMTPDRKFDKEDLGLLTRFAELASIAIENARLYTMSQQELAERKFAEEALREAEAKYRTLVEHISAITYTALLDDAKTRVYVSPQIETLLGYTQAEYLADSDLWKKMLHPNDRERVLADSKRFYETGKPFASDYRSVARDGRVLWFHDEAVLFEDNATQKRYIQGVKVDITQRMQAEALQSAIYRISDAASTSSSMDELYLAIHRSLQSVMVADNFFIALYDKATDLLSFPYDVDEYDPTPASAPLGRGLTAYVIRNGIPLLGRPDAIQKLEDSGEVESVGTRSIDWLGVPLRIQNETIGVMAVQTYQEGIRYSQRDLDILNFVSVQVALSIKRKHAEEQIKQQVERLKALRTIDMFIASGTDLHLTLQTLLNQAVSQLGIDAADILLLDTSMHALEYAEGTGFRTRNIEQSSIRIGEEFAGKAALEREMISIGDISARKETFVRQALFVGEGFTSYYGVPLIAKGEVKGVMEIFNRSRLDVDSEWMDFLESLAGQAALAIDNASLFDSLQRSNLELGLAYETTLEGWSAALDMRDKETEGHTQRVANLTQQLAEAMGLSEKERVHMRRGALLHDIGKMGIPDRILLKPDQLTGEEWEIMRQHPIYAHNLLSPIAHLRPALDIPYCHHEKWDGTGYPRGLKAEAIPLAARIFAVADVWDALCSDRPYRPAWTKEKALEHIKALSGVHFDPKIVDLFLQVVSQG